LKTLFFASDSFAIEPLEAVLASRHEIIAFLGRPDRPSGRGLKAASTPAVERAMESGLVVLQPESLTRECLAPSIDKLEWDAGVVVAYGGLIPPWLLAEPRFGFVNLHPSLLPRYRGAAPVERAIMNGTSVTGVTTIQLNEVLDAGDILLHREVPLTEEDTAGTLRDRLAHAGAKLLVETLDALEEGVVSPVPQEEDKATYAPPIRPIEGQIDWHEPAEFIDRLVRSMSPEPGAFTWFRGRRIKIWTAHVTDVPPEDDPGTIMNLGKEGFIVNTGTTGIQVITLQPEGKGRMTAAEFSRGQRLLIAECFAGQPDA
jgi:methionyl-tRNA formyltransferase